LKKLFPDVHSLFRRAPRATSATPAADGWSSDASPLRFEPPSSPKEPGLLLVNAYATHGSPPPLGFPHVLNMRRDLSDPELAPHLRGFLGFLQAQAKGAPMTRQRYHVIRHVQRVRHHVSLAIAQDQLDAYAHWASKANAIAFLRDNSVRDHRGRVLIWPGEDDFDADAEVPHPVDAWSRKTRSTDVLARHGLAMAPHLPPVIGQDELRPRDAAEIFGRAQALVVVSERAISQREGDPLPLDLLKSRLPVAFDHLSPDEQAFVVQDAPSPAQIARFGWQCECTRVLAWSLSLLDDLPFPSAICPAGEITHRILQAAAAPNARLHPRPAADILDALDLHYRLHWLTTEARIGRRPPIEGVEPGVVMERYRALNWLVRFEDADWDDVDMPT
jgi:hypothetical protein